MNEFYINLLVLTVIGIITTMLNVLINSVIQQNIDKNYIGRVFSFYKIVLIISAIFGIVLAPILLEKFNIVIPFLIIACIGLIVNLILYLFKKDAVL